MRTVLGLLPAVGKQRLKSRVGSLRRFWAERFRSYDARELATALLNLGVRPGDVLLMHSAFVPTNGFRGSPQALIEVILELLGRQGTLVMTSMAYASSTRDYLATHPCFDVRRTPSKMGVVTEIMRRRGGTLRSLSPTHPLIAYGARAESLLEGHDRCEFPCGPGSPFEKMLMVGGKMLYFDLPFIGFTFVHYIEHQIRERLPFALYDPTPLRAILVDYADVRRELEVYVFSEEAVRRRQVGVITEAMRAAGTAHWRWIGNTQLVVASMQDALATGLRLSETGRFPFEPAG